ncbi:MAG TPA: (2Fe-2S)-binding protein, partial [Phycisphaerae bacterium]|nr:(2Fe-2S)-binding protein [Phycisphaerae bacterium]
DWGLDRQSQRDGTQYTGIGNITIQDQAVTESMGPITDHDWEHLAPTDQMIARTRRRLLLAARAYRDSGELPPGASDPDTFMGARAGSFLFAPDAPLEQAYQAQLEKAVRWTAQPEERA